MEEREEKSEERRLRTEEGGRKRKDGGGRMEERITVENITPVPRVSNVRGERIQGGKDSRNLVRTPTADSSRLTADGVQSGSAEPRSQKLDVRCSEVSRAGIKRSGIEGSSGSESVPEVKPEDTESLSQPAR
jgi:hypothetical protein